MGLVPEHQKAIMGIVFTVCRLLWMEVDRAPEVKYESLIITAIIDDDITGDRLLLTPVLKPCAFCLYLYGV